jgi:hypothetical protein
MNKQPPAKSKQPPTKEEMAKLQIELKGLSKKWVYLVVAEIKNNQAFPQIYRESINRFAVYNSFNQVIKDPLTVLIVFKACQNVKNQLAALLGDAIAERA